MQITINFDTLKKIGGVALIVTNLVGFAAGVHYLNFRRTADPIFQVMEFDLNSRQPEIKAKYQALQQQIAEAQAKAATPAPAPAPATVPNTPAKETPKTK